MILKRKALCDGFASPTNNTMEILIQVPPFLQSTVESLGLLWLWILSSWEWTASSFAIAKAYIFQMPYNNVFLPILGILFVCWPILLSLAMSLAAAWAWIFWLFTSIALGCLQVYYAAYQFVMISLDIFGLSTLKTYTIVRNQILNLWELYMGKRKSRRRWWKQQLDSVGSYEKFLMLRMRPKEDTVIDTALPKRKNFRRSSSFNAAGTPPPRVTANLPRNRSFSGEVDVAPDVQIDHDPIVIDELGTKTADLLVSTTWRLRDARIAAQKDPNNEEAANTLRYLLVGVVKRNHRT